MGRSLTDIIADLPADEQAAIEQRYHELKQDVEGLRELQRIGGTEAVPTVDEEFFLTFSLST